MTTPCKIIYISDSNILTRLQATQEEMKTRAAVDNSSSTEDTRMSRMIGSVQECFIFSNGQNVQPLLTLTQWSLLYCSQKVGDIKLLYEKS